ncbi:unnamed protein product [Mytilus edulis]|uniref:B box-type domain-containing protein n=1 Tax=Mytilus edulis TaxID=6550 RepID=A0A8S3QNI5_MYTED|nr:unnamed protein product [Mytilus edulis]
MDSDSYCEPCSEEGTPIAAIMFCSDCEERLCKNCVDYHKKFKATKSHHLIDLTSILRSKIPIAKSCCEVHQDLPLDFYCTQHDTVCCRDRHGYVDEIESGETAMLVEISKLKTHLIKQINALEEKLITELSNAKKKILDLYGKENSELSELYDVVQNRKQNLEFLKEHGSNNQLYLTLREQEKGVQDAIKRVQNMTLSYKQTAFKLKKKNDIDVNGIGSIEEVRTASAIQYSPVKLQQAQNQPVKVKSILAFRKEIAEQLQIGKLITDVAVTADDKLFLCDFQKGCDNIYVFKIIQRRLIYIRTLSVPSKPFGIAVLTGTDKAIVTLPYKSYVQFIDTNTLTMDKTINVGQDCFGIATTGEYIAVGKRRDITILKQNGETFETLF